MDAQKYEVLVEATEIALCTLAVATARCTNPALLANVIQGMGSRAAQLSGNELLQRFVDGMCSAVQNLGPSAPNQFS